METPCKAWFIGGPKDCEYIMTEGMWSLEIAIQPKMHMLHQNCDERVVPAFETQRYFRHRFSISRHGNESEFYFYVIDGTDLDQEIPLAEALLLYNYNPETLETEGLEMAKELPRELWPDKRRPVRRFAAFTRLFKHRLYKCAVKHRMF
jgi:hypothetical protein